MVSEDEGLQWSCTVCKKGDPEVQRYSAGSLTCKGGTCRRTYTERRAQEKVAAREQGVAMALGKRARQGQPGPSAAAEYAALIASKRCVRIRKVSAAPLNPASLLNPAPPRALSRVHPLLRLPPFTLQLSATRTACRCLGSVTLMSMP